MPDATMTDKLDAVRRLLREGRTTEADVQLDTLEKEIREEAERRKMEIPPPAARTLKQLQIDFADVVTDLLGNPPRLINLLVEIRGLAEKEE